MKYRKKPVIIDAIKYYDSTIETLSALEDFLGDTLKFNQNLSLLIPTLEGVMEASEGDYIIKGVEGEFYPCKPSIFEKTYEEA